MPDDRDNEPEALSSILLAVISCEGFINELAALARHIIIVDKGPAWLKALGEMLDQAEDSRASTESKFQLVKFILTGEPFDKGAKPFQDFATLIEIRNALVHAKPSAATLERDGKGNILWTRPKLLQRLQSSNVIRVEEEFKALLEERSDIEILTTNTTAQLTSKTVAVWACRTVSATVNAILDSVPSDSSFASTLETDYRKRFQTP
jgi:hypothetical protein